MSSVPGDLMSCMSSCASSSICMRGQLHAFVALRLSVVYLGVVGGTGAIAVDGRRVDRGRIWAGRGTRWSECAPEDLGESISTCAADSGQTGSAHLFEKTWLKLAGELGESV